ncbi:MAG: hypothetical protein H6652_23255 [Ardenticatenaceae bacterium]|nr:hypothetical protein [Ardenticatenaceae bacterium]MCB8947165.1 hypothetical protein [Ardenticatenaceae bacterium]
MSELIISLLGRFQAQLNGQLLTRFESDNARALLAYLAVEAQQAHRRNYLAALFWPEHDEKAARNNLRQTLFKLRRLLNDDGRSTPFLIVTAQTIQFNLAAACEVDVVTVRQQLATQQAAAWETAVTHYTAPLLSQAALVTSAPFEEWLLLAREQLHQQVMTACDALLATAQQAADWAQIVPLATRQLALDPWRESTARSLMQALAAQGQRSAALAVYQQCRETLWQELGVLPMPETVALAEQIKLGDVGETAVAIPTPAPASQPPRHNLPADLTPFIGRQAQRDQLQAHLATPGCRLLTLTGIGGIGKTRLALQAARDRYADYSDGVWWVPLAGLLPDSTPEQLDAAVAEALPFAPSGAAPLRQQIHHFLQNRQVLLLFDNGEHLAVLSGYLTGLLEALPGLQCLVTAREPLGLPAEWLLPVPPLGYTGPNADETDAVRLFFQHARMMRPSFPLSVVDEPLVARICALLGGHPLAIELAAGWVDTLDCRDIVAELGAGFAILQESSRERPLRHVSMEQILRQTWQRLSPAEQRVLSQLSVFRGGCTREAAQQVAEAQLPLLKRLVDRSLLHMERVAERPSRYVLHELVRLFAWGQLGVETAVVQQRHATFFASLLAAQAERQRSAAYLDAMRQIEPEMDNIAVAWQWALAQADCAFFAQSVDAVSSYLHHNARHAEGVRLLEAALAVCGNAAHSYRLRNRLAQLHSWGATDMVQGQALAQAAFRAAHAASDWVEAAYACFQWAITLQRTGDFEPAWQKLEEGLALLENSAADWLRASLATRLCLNAPPLSRLAEGERYGRLAQEMAQRLGQPLVQWQAEYALSVLYWHMGDLPQAERHAAASVAVLAGDDFVNFRAISIQMQAFVLHRQQRLDEALVLMDAAETVARQVGDQDLLASLWSAKGEIALEQQRWGDAAQVLLQAQAIDQQAGNKWRLSQTLFLRAMALHYLGEVREATVLLQEGLSLADSLREPFITFVCLSTLLRWLALLGETTLATDVAAYLHHRANLVADQLEEVVALQAEFDIIIGEAAPTWESLLGKLQQIVAQHAASD